MMEDLSLHILDIAENAISAGATRIAISVNANEKRDILTIRLTDDGPGMSEETAGLALDPFFTTKGKRTGLGIPLLAQAAEHCGGGMSITSAAGRGTKVTATFRLRHIDRPPLTNMKGTLMTLVFGHPEIGFHYRHTQNGRAFRFASRHYFGKSRAPFRADPDLIGIVEKELRSGLEKIGAS
ncbi:MAG: ATP-binding protein [Acidobacteriota bacterium]|nr:ATP-binding protein [Acidobacteriota bacterium]